MTRKVFGTIYLFLALPISFVSAKDWSSLAIQVDGSTQRTLSDSEGNPIFWQADTAWEIFHRLNITEVEYYLADRAAKGFNVIYGTILAEEDGLTVPNQNGDFPVIDYDPRNRMSRTFNGSIQLSTWLQNTGSRLLWYLHVVRSFCGSKMAISFGGHTVL